MFVSYRTEATIRRLVAFKYCRPDLCWSRLELRGQFVLVSTEANRLCRIRELRDGTGRKHRIYGLTLDELSTYKYAET